MDQERLDRQLRIEGWNQQALSDTTIGVIGDEDYLASFFIMSAAALGINNIKVIAPFLDDDLMEIAHKVNPDLELAHIRGNFTNDRMIYLFQNSITGLYPRITADLTNHNIANKILLEQSYYNHLTLLRGMLFEDNGVSGFNIFTYYKGREWEDLKKVISPHVFPKDHFDDPVLDIVASGILLEEAKNIIMRGGAINASREVIAYERETPKGYDKKQKVLIGGAGALSNFVSMALGYDGFKDQTIIDPDEVEVTNLNRQVLLYEGVGKSKAETLSAMLNKLFGVNAKPIVKYFNKRTGIAKYNALFDCFDNFESRVIMSDKCKDKKTLISGGTNIDAGQVVVYDPGNGYVPPADLLGLHDIVDQRKKGSYKRVRESCTYRPDPSVIMTNQTIGGLMVDLYRRMLSNQKVSNIFYDSKSDVKIGN